MIIITLNGKQHTLSENIYLNEEDKTFKITTKLDSILSNKLFFELSGHQFNDPILGNMETVKEELDNVQLRISDYIENNNWNFKANPIDWDLIKKVQFYNFVNSENFKKEYSIRCIVEKLVLSKEIDIELAIQNFGEYEKENFAFLEPFEIEITGKLVLKEKANS